MPEFTLKNLNFSFGTRQLFQDIQMTVDRGEIIGLIGLNGQGKSTLLKVINGEISADHSTPPFTFDKNKAFSCFRVPQELPIDVCGNLSPHDMALFFYPDFLQLKKQLETIEARMGVEAEIDHLIAKQSKLIETISDKGIFDIEQKFENYLKAFAFRDYQTPIKNLSGGEQKKLALACALSSPCQVILWDEPTNHLDLEAIKQLESEILGLGKTQIIISHDRYLLNNVTNTIWHLHGGNLEKFSGNYVDFLESLEKMAEERQQRLTKLTNTFRREQDWMRQGIRARGTRAKGRVQNFKELNQQIAFLKSLSKPQLKFDIHHNRRKTKVLFEFDSVSFGYNEELLFKDISFVFAKNDKIALIGANGAGKSTLVELIKGNLNPKSGSVKCAEGLQIGHFAQKREALINSKTPLQLIGDGSDQISLPDGRTQHITAYLKSFMFNADQWERPISTLSGGEKNRLQLALFLSRPADVWIFDEPTNDLDLDSLQILEEKLQKFKGTVLVISHDRAFIDQFAKNTWYLYDQKLVFFEGGFEQAGPYIEAMALEQSLKESKGNRVQETAPSKDKNKPSNAQKKRYAAIPKEIEKQEQAVAKLKQKLENFDYNAASTDHSQLSQLQSDFEASEKILEALYLEWSELEEVFS